MVGLIKAAQLLLSLSILVVLHELGHYWAARTFKTRVEKFYLFMNPGFSLFKKQIGETEWGIGWLPLGGYVKISGMIDESMDTEQLKSDPQPWEFRSKPAWQRLIIMLGGIIVNLILGFAIYSMVLLVWGETVMESNKIPYGLEFHEELEALGFEDGDQILRLNDLEPGTFNETRRKLFFEPVHDVVLKKPDGREVALHFEEDLGQKMIDASVRTPISLRLPCEVALVQPGSGAETAGLQPGDRFVEIEGQPVFAHDQVVKYLRSHPGEPFEFKVSRGGQIVQNTGQTDSTGAFGFLNALPADLSEFEFTHRQYAFAQGISSGFSLAWTTLQDYVLSMRFLFSKSGASQVGSLVTFGSIFDAGWDWEVFWRNTAFFSLILAFMNLLPIPALDGGHVAFLLYEMVVGKPAPEKFLERAQIVGIVLLLSLMVFALGNDIWRLLTGQFG
jgi:regulator of sigma E protease